jgi:kynurenine formamidase
MANAPQLTDLLANAPSNWGRWGDDDEVGSLNFLTSDEVLRGVRSIRTGEVHTLQRLIGDPKGDPVWPSRLPAEREMVIDESAWDSDDAPQFPGGLHYADDKLVAFLQGSTQYDALGHVWYGGQIWNGYDARTTVGGLDKASVEPIAQRGVVGRGVLIDMARHLGVEAIEAKRTFDHNDLQEAAEAQGVTIEKHDILLIRTNHLQLFFEQGLQYSPELVQWFHDMEIPNLVTDTIANEVTTDPDTGVALTLHNALMRNLGIALTEICDLESLAAACAEDGRWDFLYAAAPLKIHRATGSPVNPLAIR